MQSQLETLSPVLVEVKVEVPWQKVNDDLESAYKAMQRKARIRGFRPGKVPRDVVKNVLGKSIRSEVTAELVRQGIGHAVEEHKLDPVSYQDLSPAAINDGEPLRFTAKLEVRPKIDQVDIAGIEVERVALKIADTAIDAEIDRLREQGAELITPEPARVSQSGDTITFDVRVSIDGEEMLIDSAGVHDIHLQPGRHSVLAARGGEIVHRELVTVTPNGRSVVYIRKKAQPAAAPTAVTT